MEKKMETLGPLKGICRVIMGLSWDNGKSNGSYCIIGVRLLYWDNGKENGSY